MICDVRFYNRALSHGGHGKLRRALSATGNSPKEPALRRRQLGRRLTTPRSPAAHLDDRLRGNKALQTNGSGGIATNCRHVYTAGCGHRRLLDAIQRQPGDAKCNFRPGERLGNATDANGIVVFDLCGEGSNDFVTTRPLIEIGRWYHVAATFDSTTDTYAIYVDGQLDKSGTNGNAMTQQAAAILSFGTRTGSTEYWQGALRDFRVYNRRLVPRRKLPSSTAWSGHWKLDETSGSLAADSPAWAAMARSSAPPPGRTGSVDNALAAQRLDSRRSQQPDGRRRKTSRSPLGPGSRPPIPAARTSSASAITSPFGSTTERISRDLLLQRIDLGFRIGQSNVYARLAPLCGRVQRRPERPASSTSTAPKSHRSPRR